MASCSVLIKTSAAKELEAVEPRAIRVRIVSRIRGLAQSPRPNGSQKLAGDEERYRIRQGAHRFVYSVDDEARVVEVVKIGHRREVYRRGPAAQMGGCSRAPNWTRIQFI